MDPTDKEHKDPDTIDLGSPRLAQYMHKAWKKHQITVYWADINLALKKGLKFYQTRSNAIILHETLPAYCIQKVVRMETGDPLFAQKERSMLNEVDIDFRISGLPHPVVKQAENSRVRELVKQIENHPHRQALQHDLQQNNAYNPFSEKSKKMIKDMGNVALLSCSRQILKRNAKNVCCTGVKASSIALAGHQS